MTDFSIGIQHFVQIVVGYLGLFCDCKVFRLEIEKKTRPEVARNQARAETKWCPEIS